MSERTERRAKLRRVEVVLHWAWDPIGVRGIPEAADEYDSYALTVLAMLERGTPDREVADYLTSVERDRMGLRARPDKNEDIAAMLRELHSITG
ncbi:hypothetical protein [Sphingosinicella sp. BN140058]|uniref:hypothetical protein n=1 Tax=Sphingosinicella sp. BN140058 TaxID=1892855 RepID=UPI001010D3D9|nr:hypothetical protein [Sphingosinicella sp. BN140058]QAY78152.1 hypothetical protein ETR14_17680 [Sphingosinicella sp. BN140058]